MPHEFKAQDFRGSRQATMSFSPDAIREDDSGYEFDVSATRDNWLDRSVFFERLDFDGMDTSFFRSGNANVFWNHRTSEEVTDVVGVIRNAWIRDDLDGGKTLMTTVRFVKDDPDSMRMFRKIESGLVRNVSVGYAPSADEDSVDFRWNKDRGAWDVEYLDFRMIELSFVGAPADEMVGIGRAVRTLISEKEGRKMPENVDVQIPETRTDPPRNDPPPAAPEQERELPADPPRMTLAEIERSMSAAVEEFGFDDEHLVRLRGRVIAEANGNPIDPMDYYREAIRLHKELNADERSELNPQNLTTAIHTTEHVASCGRMIDWARASKDFTKLDGLEGDLQAKATERWGDAVPDLGIPDEINGVRISRDAFSVKIPYDVILQDPGMRSWMRQRLARYDDPRLGLRKPFEFDARAFNVAATPDGFNVEVFDEGYFIAALYAEAGVINNVTMLPAQLVQNLIGVNETGTLSVVWTDQDDTITESTGLSFGNHKLTWKQVNVHTLVRRRVLDQSTMFLPILMSRMNRDLVRGVNRALIDGSGTKQITGIKNYTSIPTVVGGTNGSKPNYTILSKLRGKVKDANADFMSAMFAFNTTVEEAIRRLPRFTNSTGAPADRIISDNMTIDGKGIILDNNIVRSSVAKGTLTNPETMIFGDFSEIEVANFSGVELLIDPFTVAANSQIRIFLRHACDAKPRHVNSFAVIVDVDGT